MQSNFLEPLTANEQDELRQRESTIERGLNVFVDVGNALADIRDRRLYRDQYGTFEKYCQERWGFSSNFAGRHIRAAHTVGNLQTVPIGTVLPKTESQARPLTKLPDDEQAEVWQEAVETAPNGNITAAHVEETVKRHTNNFPMENYSASATEPHPKDRCQTPPYTLNSLYPFLDKNNIIWEPAAGEGYLVQAFKSNGFSVIGSDILTGQNFFDFEPEQWDMLITNPPYHSGVLGQWIERCYNLGKPFALLMKLTTLGTKYGFDSFNQYGLEMIVFDKRINFKMPNMGWDGSGAQFAACWFTWGLEIGQQITFTKLEIENTT